MKTFILTLLLALTITTHLFGQQASSPRQIELDLFYNWSYVGKNVSLMVDKQLGRHAISLGMKYHDNHFITDNRGYAFKNRFREGGPKEAFGLNIGYQFDLVKGNKFVIPYAFYLLQVSHLRLISDYTYDANSTATAGFVILDETEPFFIFEHVIGIGLQTRIFENFYLNQSFGIGNAHFKPFGPSSWNVHEALLFFRMGMTYRIEY